MEREKLISLDSLLDIMSESDGIAITRSLQRDIYVYLKELRQCYKVIDLLKEIKVVYDESHNYIVDLNFPKEFEEVCSQSDYTMSILDSLEELTFLANYEAFKNFPYIKYLGKNVMVSSSSAIYFGRFVLGADLLMPTAYVQLFRPTDGKLYDKYIELSPLNKYSIEFLH